jgi:hypothetical protein
MFNDPMFEDAFNDPFFQNFFGGTTEKEITVASHAEAIRVFPLPTEGRPAGFGGAVGNFEVNSELSAAQSAAGDPLTLRLKVTGTGSFDRVNSSMLGAVDGWKTYPPTAKFGPADSAGYSGEKDFEQAVIPIKAGRETVPALAFNFFNPVERGGFTRIRRRPERERAGRKSRCECGQPTAARQAAPGPRRNRAHGCDIAAALFSAVVRGWSERAGSLFRRWFDFLAPAGKARE